MPSPQDENYLHAISRALRCGNPDCLCASEPPRLHCPIHPTPDVPTLTVDFDDYLGFTFQCSSEHCDDARIPTALAKRGLAPDSWLFTPAGAQETGLHPASLVTPHPQDWLWPNRIPMGRLSLIAGYPSSGKTAIARDIAARVSLGAPTPDDPRASFVRAPVLIASLNGDHAAIDVPLLRAAGADLSLVYFADTLSPEHLADLPEGRALPDYEALERQAKLHERARSLGELWQSPMPDEMKQPLEVPDRPPWPGLDLLMRRLHNLIVRGGVALLVVDQVEDLAARHAARPLTVLGKLNGLAARTGAAVIAVAHNPEPSLPKAARSMRRLIPAASAIFTTALAGPNRRRVLVPLRPPMDDAPPPIPYSLASPKIAWRRPIPPWRLNALVRAGRNARTDNRGKRDAARNFILHSLAKGPKPAALVKREAEACGISLHQLRQARAFHRVLTTRTRPHDFPKERWCWTLPPKARREMKSSFHDNNF